MRANLADSSSLYMLRVSMLPDAVDDFVAIEAPEVSRILKRSNKSSEQV